jgi:XrtJ-associated TM-motif-TM protein
MKRSALAFLGIAVFLSVALPLRAQTGCEDSPENPTAVLALVGSAGALISAARSRLRVRRRASAREALGPGPS